MPDAPPADGIFGLDTAPEDARVIVIPVPWEATTSYGRGTARGPGAIVRASVQVDLFDVALGTELSGVAMLEVDPWVEARAAEANEHALRVIGRHDGGHAVAPDDADLQRVNQLSAELNAWVRDSAATWRRAGKLVGVVGGDHSVAFGAIAAAADAHPGCGVLQIDAHADLRSAYQGFEHSHASVMHNVMRDVPGVHRLVSVGVRDLSAEEHAAIQGRVGAHFDATIARRLQAGECWQSICREIVGSLPEDVYVSFDIDGLDPVLCPNTGTPVPGGLSFQQMEGLLLALVEADKNVVGFDLCEVAPGDDEWDANVGARVLHKLIGCALAERTASGE